MAFQDFDQITERRKTENAKKFKKRIIIVVVTVHLLVGIVVGAVFLEKKLTNRDEAPEKETNHAPPSKRHDSSADDDGDAPKVAPAPPSKKPDSDNGNSTVIDKPLTTNKLVEKMCESTDYTDKCNQLFTNNKNPISKPREVIKTIISGASDEAKSAFIKAGEVSFNKDEEKKAFEDCKTLFQDAEEELEQSLYLVGNTTETGRLKIGRLNSWLSAVISYSQTCIDGLPDGDGKYQMTKTLEATKELTSVSLAMISQIGNAPGNKSTAGPSRRLLAQDKDGFPSWMTYDERRVLKKSDDNLTPNVIVAKDGSGKYRTISEALSAMPYTVMDHRRVSSPEIRTPQMALECFKLQVLV